LFFFIKRYTKKQWISIQNNSHILVFVFWAISESGLNHLQSCRISWAKKFIQSMLSLSYLMSHVKGFLTYSLVDKMFEHLAIMS
jgi:hypothetical protein